MSAGLARPVEALPSVEKARAALAECRSAYQVRKIRAVAQAVATLERGKEIAIDAGEIMLMADVRIGELTDKMQSACRGGRPDRGESNCSKAKQLDVEGISRKQAFVCEKVASLSKRLLDAYVKACRKAKQPPTTAGAFALAKLAEVLDTESPATFGDLADVRRLKTEARRAERTKKLAEIARGNASLAVGEISESYPVLYADPPWRYEHSETECRAVENQYPTMSLDEIRGLPMRIVSTEDAVLFLWAPSPKLTEALSVIEAWGFTYRTCAVWVKDKIGMGYYFRQRHELLLVATRGAPPTPAPDARADSVIEAPREKHSAKPALVHALIEEMYPTLPRMELFARKKRDGWAAWGNQVGSP